MIKICTMLNDEDFEVVASYLGVSNGKNLKRKMVTDEINFWVNEIIDNIKETGGPFGVRR